PSSSRRLQLMLHLAVGGNELGTGVQTMERTSGVRTSQKIVERGLGKFGGGSERRSDHPAARRIPCLSLSRPGVYPLTRGRQVNCQVDANRRRIVLGRHPQTWPPEALRGEEGHAEAPNEAQTF